MGDDLRLSRNSLLAEIDADGNDILTHEEVKAHVDANNDGFANADEWIEARNEAVTRGLTRGEARTVMQLANTPGGTLRGVTGRPGPNEIEGWASARTHTLSPLSAEMRRANFTRVHDSMPASSVRPKRMFVADQLRSGLEGVRNGAPEAGALVRAQLRALLAEFGVVSRDGLESRSGAHEFEIDPNLPWGGAHFGSGRIATSQETFDNALGFLSSPRARRTPEQAGGFRTLIHEELHGASAVGGQAWSGVGELVEHVTVEAAAQGILARRFEVPPLQIHSPSHVPRQMDDVTNAIVLAAERAGADVSFEQAAEILFDASIAMRADADRAPASTPNQVLVQFLNVITPPPGVRPAVFRQSLLSSINRMAEGSRAR